MKTTTEAIIPTTGDGGTQLDAYVATGDSPPNAENAERVVDIALGSLLDEAGTFRTVQVREAVNQSAVDAYAAAMQRGEADKFPPIIVYEVTDRGGMRFLSAGLHRCSAARQAGRTNIRGHLRQGTWHEALAAAITTNATHGHRPTMGDVCETLLQMEQDPEYRLLSNVKKAELIGVSEGTVRNALKQLEATSQVTRSNTRTVTRKDGTTYQLPIAKATSQGTRSEETEAGSVPEARVVDMQAAVGTLQAVVTRAVGMVDELRTVGLDGEVVPASVLARYREGVDAARQKWDAQMLKAAAHMLGTLAQSVLGKAA